MKSVLHRAAPPLLKDFEKGGPGVSRQLALLVIGICVFAVASFLMFSPD
ncbi:hypothetical protein HFN89_00425 [Rhizobium laguerreae]|nr:hypothetical protein [Rhizobium laguerreae]